MNIKVVGKVVVLNNRFKYIKVSGNSYLIPNKLSSKFIEDNYYTVEVCTRKKEVVRDLSV